MAGIAVENESFLQIAFGHPFTGTFSDDPPGSDQRPVHSYALDYFAQYYEG